MKEMWDERFAAEEYYYGTEPNPFFKLKLDKLIPGRILIPGDGEGRNGVYAATKGWKVLAVDYSTEGRKKALKLASEKSVTIDYRLDDITRTDFGEAKYDAIGLVYIHLVPEIRREIHRKLIKSLKPGGYIILEAFNKNQIANSSGGPKVPDMLFNIEMLETDFAGLEILELEESSLDVEAGRGHMGRADIIRFYGRK